MGGDLSVSTQERIAAGIRRWRDDLNAALEPHLRAPLEWDEDQDRSLSMTLPTVAHRALLLLAAHAQKTEHAWPDDVPSRVDTDPAFQEISEGNFARCHYPQVVIPSFWVPGDFALTMKHALPDGEEVVLGSLDGLQAQLRQLNQNTLQLGQQALGDQAKAGPAPGEEFVAQATYGLSIFTRATEEALALRVPARLAT